MKKEKLVLTKTTHSCEGKSNQTQHNALGYRIELYFHDYKLAIEVDESGASDRNIDYETKRQKVIEQELDCEFIRIDPD